MFRHLTGLVIALTLICGTASAQTVVLQPTMDNTLYEDALGTLSNGSGQYFFAGTTASDLIRRGLLSFDVAGNVPAGATIDSVTLDLFMSRTSAGAQDVAVYSATAGWGEGTSDATGNEGGGAASTPGDATWIHTTYDTSFWATPGGDFVPVASATQSVAGVGSYSWTSSQLAADCQAWLDNPAQNFGLVLIGNEAVPLTAKRFDSRENPTIANWPTLTISYTPVPVELQTFTIE